MNIFKQLWLSLYSPKDIAKFRFQGIGKTILYVFLLVFISTLPSFVYTTGNVKDGIHSFQDAIKSELPAFEISNGKLTTEATEPVIYTDNDFTIIVDGTGQLTSSKIQLEYQNALALLQSEFVILVDHNIQAQPYSLFDGFTITLDDIKGFSDQIEDLLTLLIVIVGIFTYIFAAGLKFIELSIFALFGTMFFNVYRKNLQYRHLWILSAYSMTLTTIFFAIMNAMQTTVIGGVLVNWGISLVILYLAIKEIPKPKTKKTS